MDFEVNVKEKITNKISDFFICGVEIPSNIYYEIKNKYGKITNEEVLKIYENEYRNSQSIS